MDFLTPILDWIDSLPPLLLLVATGVLVLAETTIGVGFIVPGESGLLIAATSVRSVPDFLVLWLVVSVCAGIGDSIGYVIGRTFGPKLRNTKVIRKHGTGAWDRATGILRRRGAWAVFFARFLPVVRTLTPAAAGTSNLPFRKFLPAVLAGAACWSALHIGLGAGLGEAARQVEDILNTGGTVVVVLGAVLLVVLLLRFKRKREDTRSTQGASAQEQESAVSPESALSPKSAVSPEHDEFTDPSREPDDGTSQC